MSGFIHLSQWSSWEDFFAGIATTKKKLTDKPKTWGVWQSTGFSSLKQHRLSRHAGWEQVWFSVWWSDYHKLPLIFFSFLACLPFTVCYKNFCAWYSVILFSPPKVFWYNLESTYSHTILQRNSTKTAIQAVSLWKNTESNINNTTVCPHLFHPVTAS